MSNQTAFTVPKTSSSKLGEMTEHVRKYGFDVHIHTSEHRRSLTNLKGHYVVLDAKNNTLTISCTDANYVTSAHPETCVFSQFSSPLEVGAELSALKNSGRLNSDPYHSLSGKRKD